MWRKETQNGHSRVCCSWGLIDGCLFFLFERRNENVGQGKWVTEAQESSRLLTYLARWKECVERAVTDCEEVRTPGVGIVWPEDGFFHEREIVSFITAGCVVFTRP